MEGVLWKWTNYWNGWQPRWFVLDNGILSYYKSQEEVNQGCKGSVKLSACEIAVHQTDPQRMDLVIPSQQHYYLRAASPQIRQQWLVALGSAKATFNSSQVSSGMGNGTGDSLKLKKSELRLYCDLLVQQVHTIKTSIAEGGQPDPEKMGENANLLSATCDTFIKTLDECMKLANANFTYEMPHQHVRDSALPAESNQSPTSTTMVFSFPHHQNVRRGSKNWTAVRSASTDSPSVHKKASPSTGSLPTTLDDTKLLAGLEKMSKDSDSVFINESESQMQVSPTPSTADEQNDATFVCDFPACPERKVNTFFSTLPNSFIDVHCDSNGFIPTVIFLDSCRAILRVFDYLNSTAFAPVKMDIEGNIRKLHLKFSSNPQCFTTLQAMVLDEIQNGTVAVKNSSTDALLWLKRALEFINAFLEELLTGEPDLRQCAGNAYARTLKQYHGWILRGVFAVTLKALPDRESFVSHLAPSQRDFENENYETQLYEDGRLYVSSLGKLLETLNQFYKNHDLDNTAKV